MYAGACNATCYRGGLVFGVTSNEIPKDERKNQESNEAEVKEAQTAKNTEKQIE